MTNQDPWFFEDRAIAFAKLMLTKYHNVRPYDGTDMGIDLLVEIRREPNPTRRRPFGIQIIPYMDLPDAQDADERVLSHLGRDPGETGLPICVFVIGVRKPDGIYRWAVEPVLEEGQAVLRQNGEKNWQTLDEENAARLIDQVNAWYDAQDGSPPKPRGRRAKTISERDVGVPSEPSL